jgi:hypothetical protein
MNKRSKILIVLILLLVSAVYFPPSHGQKTICETECSTGMRYYIVIHTYYDDNISLPNVPILFRINRLSAHDLWGIGLPLMDIIFTNETGVFDSNKHYEKMKRTGFMERLTPGMIIRFFAFQPWYGWDRTQPIILRNSDTELHITMRLQRSNHL